MATLQTQYKNWLLDNPNEFLTYQEWFNKLGEIYNLPTGISEWNVTLQDGLENEPPYVSDDFQIGPYGAYEHGKSCYCGKPVDTSDPDCITYSLCEEHASDV